MKTQHFNNMKTLVSFILKKNRKELPDLSAIISDENTITYSELYDLVEKTVQYLSTLKLPHGITVALRFQDPFKHLIYYLSLLKMGICQLALNPKNPVKLQKKIMTVTNIGLIIQDIPRENSLLKETIYISKEGNPSETLIPWGSIDIQHNTYPDIAAEINIGSGTTGTPKFFIISSSSYADRMMREIPVHPFSKGERYYIFSEFYYLDPRNEILVALSKGLTILLPKAKPQSIIKFCCENKVDHLELTGSQAIRLLLQGNELEDISSLQLPNLKSLMLTSSLITEEVRQKILTNITTQLYINYGTNEFGIISLATPEDIARHPGTVGTAIPGVDLNIVDNDGKPCQAGEIGNIVIKSPNMNTFYIDNLQATEQTFKGGDYYPGDVGKMMEDGNIIFEGRKDDMMIYRGANIYPREIETILEAHPNVIEAAAFPLTTKEHEQIPVATVSINAPTDEAELVQWCTEELGWKGPQRILFMKELPRNKTGKVLKKELAKNILIDMKHKAERFHFEKQKIPKIIHQSFYDRGLPDVLKKNVKKLLKVNPDWEYRFYDDQDQEEFIRLHYGTDMLAAYHMINPLYGAARTDFFRYLLIYEIGGVWLDIKSSISQNLDSTLKENDLFLLSQWPNRLGEPFEKFGLFPELCPIPGGEFQQWHIVSAPKNPFLKAVIQRVLYNIRTYTPEKFGVGFMGALRTTGPIAYTLAIAPLLKYYPHRFVNIHEDMKFIYSIFDHRLHRKLFKTHYSQLHEPLILNNLKD